MTEFCEACGYETSNPSVEEGLIFCKSCSNDGADEMYLEITGKHNNSGGD